MRHPLTYLTALIALALPVAPTEAGWACLPIQIAVPIHYEYRTVTKYRTEYRTEFKEVQRTVKRRVPETELKEVQETVKVPFWREEVRQKTILVPVTKMVTRKREVPKTEWIQEQREKTVMVPETRLVEKQKKILVPGVREEQRERVVSVPETRLEQRDRPVTTVRQVAATHTQQVVTTARITVPIIDPCTGLAATVCQLVPQLKEICVTTVRPVT